MKKSRTYKVLTHNNGILLVGKTGKGKITSKEALETSWIEENQKDERIITIEDVTPHHYGSN